MYSYQEALDASTEYFSGDELAARVFVDKYALRNNDDEILEKTPDDMHRRLAKEFARVEKNKFKNPLTEDEIFELFRGFKRIVPQGSPMYGIGNPYQYVSYGNCFVIPNPTDSYLGIMYTDTQITQISSRRGGVGWDVSDLRPVGTSVKNAAKSTTGTISFMKRFSNTVREVGQCVCEGERVLTENGLKPIEEVIIGEKVWTKSGWIVVKNLHANGVKPIYELTSDFGYKIKTSNQHVFLNEEMKEVTLEDLEINDKIVIIPGNHKFTKEYVKFNSINYIRHEYNNSNRLVEYTLPQILDEELAYFLGYSYGDGCIDNTYISLAATHDYPEIENKLARIIKAKFNYNAKISQGCGAVNTVDIYSKYIVQWLRENGIAKGKSANLVFPEKIKQSPASVQAAFCSGYFDADGTAKSNKKGYSVTSIDYDFIHEYQNTIMSLGVPSKEHFQKSKIQNWKDKWSIAVTGTYAKTLFKEIFSESVKVKLANFTSSIDKLLTPYKAKQLNISRKKENNYCAGEPYYLSCNCLKKLKEDGYKTPEVLVQDSVRSIEYIGERETFDLELESEHLFYCEGFYIHNSGRRGASLQSLAVNHPEILDFIKVKQDLTQVTGSNISVKFTDEFLQSVEKDKEFELKWPVDSDTPKISKVVKAKDIWKEFIHSAWLMAEPGAMYWDTVIRRSTTAPYRKFGYIEKSSNPCILKGSLVNTPNGYKKVEDIKKGDLISTVLGSESVENIDINSNVPTFKVTFSDGGVQYVTESHIYHTIPSQKVRILPKKVSELETGDAVRVYQSPLKDKGTEEDYKYELKQGILIGDGCYTPKTVKESYISISCNIDEQLYIDNLKKLFGTENFAKDQPAKDGSKSYDLLVKTKSVSELIQKPGYSYEKYLEIERYDNISKVIGVLDGMLATDGNVNLKSNHAQVRWMTTSPQLAQDIRKLLLTIGCHGFISKSNDKSGKINGRQIVRKHPKYTITISGNSIQAYCLYSRIAEIHPEKGEKLKRAQIDFKLSGNCWTVKVKNIEPYTVGEVYDLYCKESDSWITEGYVQYGCGEQYLPPYASCRLILINLYTYVKNRFTKKAYFDFEEFVKDVRNMQRLGDDMVDLELEAVDRIIKKIKSDPESDEIKKPGLDLWKKIKECAINDRRTGCGFTALGDCVAALNLKFDSKESLDFIDKMSEALKVAAFTESVEMAKELGPFPIYDSSLDISSEFVQELRDEHPELYKKMVKYGRRNMTLLTVAPAGSVSCETQTTSGLEPTFMLEYKRRKKGNPGDKDFRSDFIDQNGDHWMEFIVRHHGLQEWMDITGKTDIKESPYHGSTAHDIDWVEKVKMQSIIGKHIDNSLSVTVNLPNDVTEEKVSEIYLTAWKTGCKGMTIYRDGCRTGVLVSNETPKQSDKLCKTNAPPRPKSLPCDVHHLTVKGVRYCAIIGLMENEPYEVFIMRNCNSEGDSIISRTVTKAKLDKQKRGHYNIIGDDEEVIYQIVSANCEEHEEMLARMTSTALRHGSDISFIVHQLEKTRGDMQSFSKVIARTLKKYVPDGTEVKGEICQNCSGKLIRASGCIECPNCGWSKC